MFVFTSTKFLLSFFLFFHARVGGCVRVWVCVYIVIVKYSLVFEWFLAPCFIELLMLYC